MKTTPRVPTQRIPTHDQDPRSRPRLRRPFVLTATTDVGQPEPVAFVLRATSDFVEVWLPQFMAASFSRSSLQHWLTFPFGSPDLRDAHVVFSCPNDDGDPTITLPDITRYPINTDQRLTLLLWLRRAAA